MRLWRGLKKGIRRMVMGNLIKFNYGPNRVRVVTDKQGGPWWIASDVCEVLGLTNVTEALRRLDDDERSTLRISEGGPKRNIISEAGLYSLILRSNKPNAKKFKRWITHEVLPSIRKTGKYEVGNLSEIDLIIKSAQALKTIESKQIEHDKRLSDLEARQHQNSGHTGFWTITAWCKLNQLNLSLNDAMIKGREATRVSKEWEVEIGTVPDERFGVVNSYREDVLEEVFSKVEATT
jgi:prophage antirepressor-like protein